MKTFTPIALLLFLLSSCGVKTENKTSGASESTPSADTDVALAFINDYVKQCNDTTSVDAAKWVEANEHTTDQFKMSYKKLVEEATADDDEMGLESDPIFDAQDYPEKGFELQSADQDGYVTLKGIDWTEFKTVVKITSVGGKSMVDGTGVINIPEDKRAKRE